MTKEQFALLHLIRLAIDNEAEPLFPFDGIDWKMVIDLSFEQGVAAIAVDGLQRLYDEIADQVRNDALEQLDSPSLEDLKYEWFGSVMENETTYENHREVISKLSGFYKRYDVYMMILKGYGLSLNYPVPSHRPSGDIDIYLFGKQEDADKWIAKELNVEVDNSEHKHSVFNFGGIHIENHYDILNVYSHKTNAYLDNLLKRMASEESIQNDVEGKKVYLPSPNFNALYLLRHTSAHLSGTEIKLRHLLDWGTFVRRYGSEVDWEMVEQEAQKAGMLEFYKIQNWLCWKYFGFDKSLFAAVDCNEALADRVLNDILSPECQDIRPRGVVRYIWHRYKFWKANIWKHKLAYANENIISMFLVQAWSHLLKPASLKN